MQQDLFDSGFISSSSSMRLRKTDFLGRFRVSLRLDQVLMGLIVMLFFCVVIFSFGVEKGKRDAKEEIAAERAKRGNILQAFRVKRFIGVDPILEASQIRSTPQKMQEVVHRRAEALQAKVLETTEAPKPISGNYTIQMITYVTESAANRQLHALSKRGYQGFVIPSGKYLQICVNSFDSRQKAAQTLISLRNLGIVPQDAYVRTIPH